jgi:putative spermidine/putrescine transport system permease protein
MKLAIPATAVPYLEVAPMAVVFLLFLVAPMTMVLVASFFDYNMTGLVPTLTFHNYISLLTSPITLALYLETLKFALIVWAITLVLGFTVAYFLAFHVRNALIAIGLLLLCTVPFWTSNIIRMISWIPLLGTYGVFNRALLALGIVDQPVAWLLFSEFAVVVAYVHLFTLFMIVPIFNSMARIDRSLIEAAVDCGAGRIRVMTEVVIPLSKTGIALGSIFVIALVMGDFFVVKIMGGGRSASVGMGVFEDVNLLFYPPAAASAVVLLIIVTVIVSLILRLIDVRKELTRYTAVDLATAARTPGRRPGTFYVLAAIFTLFALFLYGPMACIYILSFQGPNGGLTFPLNGVSTHWFGALFHQARTGDIAGAFSRSIPLAVIVLILTVIFSLAAGLAFRRRFIGATFIFYVAVASLIVPGLVLSVGIGLGFQMLGIPPRWYSSALGAHLSWTLPFGLLIMFAVFGRLSRSYEEAARDLGASAWQSLRHVVIPIVLPGIIGVALFGFTLSYDEFPRSWLTVGPGNTLPLEIWGMTTNITSPALYALGTVTTAISFVVIAAALISIALIQSHRTRLRVAGDRGPQAG